MASLTLYPPIVESSMPAFIAGQNAICRIYFSLSQFNTREQFTCAHVSIIKQDTGLSVVNRIDGSHYRATGIILNVPIHSTDQENLWYIEIFGEDIGYQNQIGWNIGWFYKVQIRLSNVLYYNDISQAVWLNSNSQFFSEWSTATLIKAIGDVNIQIPILEFDSKTNNENLESISLMISTLDITGTYQNNDPSELLHSYRIKLYKNDELFEDSGVLYTNQYVNSNEFAYTCKSELVDNSLYKLIFLYQTINGYTSEEVISFSVLQIRTEDSQIFLKIFGENEKNDLESVTTIALEEDEGRVGIRFQDMSETAELFFGNLCIRRTDVKSNYKVWHDIAIIPVVNQLINDVPIFYDYTVESGVIYKYGVQTINKKRERGNLNITDKKIIRSFEYNYLLGENNQQLKLMFNNNMNNFKPVRNDAKTDTIGGAYPFITRNGATKYKTFPITGLISFNMDENNLFLPADFFNEDIGRLEDIYTKERFFRDAVLDFILDGKPKLFKSPTEGNVIVRLTDVSCTPEQALGRLIYSFSATAYEIAEPTMENYLKYNFYTIGECQDEFTVSEFKIGQLNQNFAITENICNLIKEKYFIDNTISNFTQTVKKIIGLRIIFNGEPLRIKNNIGNFVSGNNIQFNGKILTIYSNTGWYEFDKDIILTPNDELYLLGDEEGLVDTIPATIDFIYEVTTSKTVRGKKISSNRRSKGIGQIFKNVVPDESIYNSIYYKYYIEWEKEYRRLNRLLSIEIEASPGAVFKIKDSVDTELQEHIINATGILNLSNLSDIMDIIYCGKMVNGELVKTNDNININYSYYLLKGYYQ